MSKVCVYVQFVGMESAFDVDRSSASERAPNPYSWEFLRESHTHIADFDYLPFKYRYVHPAVDCPTFARHIPGSLFILLLGSLLHSLLWFPFALLPRFLLSYSKGRVVS